jgi:hypothetical protein
MGAASGAAGWISLAGGLNLTASVYSLIFLLEACLFLLAVLAAGTHLPNLPSCIHR